MQEILNLIYEYSTKDKLIDKYFIEKFIALEIKSKNIASYIKNINILKENTCLASYIYNSKDHSGDLNICINRIKEELEVMANKFELFHTFSSFENKFYSNAFICQTILHELIHVSQFKDCDSSDSMSADLLRLEYGRIGDDYVKEFFTKGLEWLKNYYQNNYEIALCERLAEIKSHLEMINILSYIANDIPNLIAYFQILALNSVLNGYIDENYHLISPTLKYIEGMGLSKYLNLFNWFNIEEFRTINQNYRNKIDVKKRIILGLPILNEEFMEFAKHLTLTKMFK